MSVYSWGYNYFHQVDTGLGRFVLEPEEIDLASTCDDYDSLNDAVVDCAAGGAFTILATEKGTLIQWGLLFDKLYTRRDMIYMPVRMESLSCGSKHVCAISELGQVYTWGCGFFGRLGHGNEASYEKPKLVEYLWKASRNENQNGDNFIGSVDKVSCGGSHTLVGTSDGRIYAFGFNRYFQCGQSDTSRYSVRLPRSLPLENFESNEVVVDISAGRHHCVLLTNRGLVYAWGNATLGRLGHYSFKSSSRMISYPRKVESFLGTTPDNTIKKIAAGGSHSMALSESGKVFTWGDGSLGQLGHGNLINQTLPKLVMALKPFKTTEIYAGMCTSMAVVAPSETPNISETWMWGVRNGGGGESPNVGFGDDCHEVDRIPRRLAFQESILKASIGGAHTVLISRPSSAVREPFFSMGIDDDFLSESSSVDPEVEALGKPTIAPISSKLDLFFLCRHGRIEELQLGIDLNPEAVNEVDENGNSLLIVACQSREFDIVKYLIDIGSDVNHQNSRGQTALHYAFTYKFFEICEYLIENGADGTVVNSDGLTCYEGLREK